MPAVSLDESVGSLLLKYARLVVGRGYIHNSLGNIAIRVPHSDFEHGVAYTKHAEISLEEMTLDHVVITDIPTPALLHGTVPTSVGHNLNREILRLRPDIGAVIHVHHDETIALFASGAVKELRVLSLEFPYVMAKPPHRRRLAPRRRAGRRPRRRLHPGHQLRDHGEPRRRRRWDGRSRRRTTG
jgi:ribulose-5-phosphate 4-epimerase/fuculose-1-phosphate aldolase